MMPDATLATSAQGVLDTDAESKADVRLLADCDNDADTDMRPLMGCDRITILMCDS